MNTKRLAGVVCLLAVVAVGVVGVDRWTKEAKARDAQQTVQVRVAASEPQTAPPRSTVHFQVDPAVPMLPVLPSGALPSGALPPVPPPPTSAPPISSPPPSPPVPPSPTPPITSLPDVKESLPPLPLTSTGELEKKLKQSLDNLQKVLPTLASAEESSPPPNEPAKREADTKLPALPPPPGVVPAPDVPPAGVAPPLPPPVSNGPPPGEVLKNVDAPTPAPVVNPMVLLPRPNIPAADPFSAVIPPPATVEPATVRNVAASIPPREDFQKRLAELEMKYLKETTLELGRRIQQMPPGDAERKRLEMDHQRMSDRLARLTKIHEMMSGRRVDENVVKVGAVESPWSMNLETVDGKTVLQMTVHRKARFKITCDRLDLQTPHGTLLGVGHVQIAGEGFHGTCDRLSIPLHDDRLILEGSAEVGVRAHAAALVEERKDGTVPRSLEEAARSGAPVLHLKGDHLDLRWSDLQPGAGGSAQADDPQRPTLRATAGPMVKVSYNAPGEERWSGWGILRRTTLEREGRPVYVLEDAERKPLVYIHTPAGMTLAEYLGKRVSVFGRPSREEGRPALTFLASHVAWE